MSTVSSSLPTSAHRHWRMPLNLPNTLRQWGLTVQLAVHTPPCGRGVDVMLLPVTEPNRVLLIPLQPLLQCHHTTSIPPVSKTLSPSSSPSQQLLPSCHSFTTTSQVIENHRASVGVLCPLYR